MKKGFLLGGSPSPARAMTTLAAAAASTVAATRAPLGPVDNLLNAASVAKQKIGGAKALRIECDFVTCSQ